MQPHDGNFWKTFLEKYNAVVKSDYKNNPVLKIDTFRDNEILDLNSYSFFLAVNLLEKEGLKRVALGEIINDKNISKGFGVEMGLVLGTEKFPNEYLVKQLTKQARERKHEFSSENPLVFKPSDLEIILDKRAPEGIGFKIKESANPLYAPELSFKNNKKRFNNVNEKELPVFDENGIRTMYTRQGGLLKIYLSKYGDLCSWDSNLVKSDSDNRLVVLKDFN